MKEIWEAIPGYDGNYLASNKGRVKSVYRVLGNGGIQPEAIKKQRNSKGYNVVSIKYNNIKKTLKVHRLVALSFIPNPDKKPQINHINGIKKDNRVENLEWSTGSENVQHAFDIGLNKQYTGSDHYMAVKVNQFTKDGIFVKTWGCISDACRRYNIKIQSLSSCLVCKSKTSGGFKWQYL